MADQEEQPQAPPLMTQAVAVKAPEFTEAVPSLFFRLLEAQFHLKNITQTRTQFFHALSALPANVLIDIPSEELEKENYDELKQTIIATYERTKPELFDKLMSNQVMTGRPSAYLRQLQQLATKVGVNDELVRHKFLANLPPSIAPVVAASTGTSLIQLGTLADESMALYNSVVSNSSSNRISHVKEVPKINRGKDSSFSSETKPVQYGTVPFHPDQKPKICRFHLFYAEKARRCKPWCRFPSKKNCSMQPSSRSASPARSTASEN